MYGMRLLRINYTVGPDQILHHIPIWTGGRKKQGNSSAKLMLGDIQPLRYLVGVNLVRRAKDRERGKFKCDISDPSILCDTWSCF